MIPWKESVIQDTRHGSFWSSQSHLKFFRLQARVKSNFKIFQCIFGYEMLPDK